MGVDIRIKIGPYVKCLKPTEIEFDEELSCKAHGRKFNGKFCDQCGAVLDRKRIGKGSLKSDICACDASEELDNMEVFIENMGHAESLYDIYMYDSGGGDINFEIEPYDVGIFEIDEELFATVKSNFIERCHKDIETIKGIYGADNVSIGFGLVQNAE